MDKTLLRYNALDSACMMEIYEKFWPSFQDSPFYAGYQHTVSLFPVLMYMQTKGMRVNHSLLEETKQDVLDTIARKQLELNELVGRPLNVNSSKQCAAYFYVELGYPPIVDRKTKKVTTNDMAMQRMVRGTERYKSLPQAKLVQEIRGLQKLYGTYLNIAFDDDSRMRGSYNPRGTKFGRLSSSKTVFGTGTNFQNLPPEFKKFLVPDEGKILLEVDKRQAEWVVVAYNADDPNMIRAIESGTDVHAYTASLMFELPIDIITRESKLVGHSTNADHIATVRSNDPVLSSLYDSTKWPRTMSLRQCGKKSNHGLNYDEGYMNFALINEMPNTEAKRVVSLYHSIYPGIKKSYETIKKQLQRDRTLSNCFGRKQFFMGEWNQDLWKSSYSFIPQSTVVDSLNMGMVAIYNDSLLCKEWDIDIIAQVHDSILLQIPISIAQDPVKFDILLQKIYNYISPTITYNNNSFKIATDAKIGWNWGSQDKETNPEGMRDYSSFIDVTNLLAEKGAHVEGRS